jgi:predicted HTH domain antitoxin
MTVTVQFDLPTEIEKKLRLQGPELGTQVKEAYALELYRQEKISFSELSQMLGLNRVQTSELLQRHEIYVGALTMEDLEEQSRNLDEAMKRAKSR